MKRALPWALQWMDGAAEKQRKHFDLVVYIYFKLDRPVEQIDIVKQMIEIWPDDRSLWQQWISLLVQTGRDDDAFEVNLLMYKNGMIAPENEILKLAQYHSFYGMPYWGAKLLEAEMKSGRVAETQANLEVLSDYWRQAREYERAIPVLEKAVAGTSDKRLHAALGEAYYNRGDCTRAKSAFDGAMALGYDAGKSWMLIATCEYEKSQAQPRLECRKIQPCGARGQ